jgi:hypothetical protein
VIVFVAQSNEVRGRFLAALGRVLGMVCLWERISQLMGLFLWAFSKKGFYQFLCKKNLQRLIYL